jgi:dUTP pyrophosphatase
MLHNDSNAEQVIMSQERIAQFGLLPFIPIEWNEVEELSNTVRGEGGFGSTGRV